MGRFVKVLGGVVGLGLIGLGVWLWTPSPPPFNKQDAIKTARLYDARIIRDKYGVPHIYGARDADVAFGLAYAHAEDDIDNIQSAAAFARGRLGLQTGREGAVTDYLVAALGVHETVDEKYLTDLLPETRALLDAYVAGINFYCAETEKVPRCQPGFAPLNVHDLVATYSARMPIFYGLEGVLTDLFEGNLEIEASTKAVREAVLRTDARVTIGSNAMAVAPSRSADGHTRLMVNSHQPFIGQVAWYEVRLKSGEGWDIIGGLFPGLPLVSVGANPDLGWAMTVNKPDLADVYKLVVDDEEQPTKYLLDGSWQSFKTSEAKFRIKLFGPFSFPVTRTTRRSVHGPVFQTDQGVFAIAFAGDGNIKAIEQWYLMNKANTFEKWLDAMRVSGIPSFNVVYGDKGGNIGYFYNAMIPKRSPNWDWSKVAPGDRSDLVWLGNHPFGAAPSVTNPASGYVVNSNHTPFASSGRADNPHPADFPLHFGIPQTVTNRGLRAQALYGGDDQISAEEFLSYKMDAWYDPGSAIMIHLRELAATPAIANNPDYAEALALFAGWDGHVTQDGRAIGLAIRATQLARGIEMRGEGPEVPDPETALAQAIGEYMQGFGRIDPEWHEVNRLKRDSVDLPLRGAPDVLRAIYSIDNPKDGPLNAIAGDSYILYADWDENGEQTVQTIHQYGAATLDESSPHYADQTGLFANEQYKTPPLELADLLKEATRDYRPGR